MAYARKVLTKKANLKTSSDLCSHLWSTFMQLSKDSTRIDIIFDLYHDKSIKGSERSHQGYLPEWSGLINHFLLKWKSVVLCQKTKYHSNDFSLNGYRQNTLCTLHQEDENSCL